MTRHLLKWISGFKMVAWCSPSDDFMSPALVGSSAAKSPPDTLVVEPKLCDCEPCLAAWRALLSPPATDGGAKVDDYPDSRNAREHVAASERAASSEEQKGRRLGALTRAVPSERAAAQACATPQPRTCIAHNETMPCPVRGCVNAVRP